ncbi:MAG TPA: tetratricopeptide repeat protein [Candidatus Binataceae bacterium]|nr:tetratricopeptide repeat protein [Candidatus Binataceae bacterium]
MRFCPHCGAPLMAGAKFCVECGRSLGAAASSAGSAEAAKASAVSVAKEPMPITFAFVAVFIAITVIGLGAAAWIMWRTPAAVKQQVASAPVAQTESSGPLPNGGASNSLGGTAGNNAPNQLPAGHPRVQLPTEARSFIDKIEKDANAKPKDPAAWIELGNVSMRAAMFDDTYYSKALDAYGHVLKLDPDNLQALRGIGDIDYDTNKYDQAVAAYEHFLKKKPDDPEVRTDLGTMYLYTGNPDQALVQYQRALKIKPDMFQAYYNMGVAFAQQNKQGDAQAALTKAYSLAPDDNAKSQVKDLMAKIAGGGAGPVASAAPDANAPQAASASAVTQPATTFQGDLEQIVRGLPIAGPKVGSFQWASKTQAKILMDNFPMDQMPPFAKQKFMTDLKSGIDTAKKDYKVSAPVEVQIVDTASGRVMETVTE